MATSPRVLNDDAPLLVEHPTFDAKKVRVLLWSKSQNALHEESLEDMLEANAAAFRENRRMDFVPLIIGDDVVVDAMAEAVRPTLHTRIEAEARKG